MPGHCVYGLKLHDCGWNSGVSPNRPIPSRCRQNPATNGVSLPPEPLRSSRPLPNCRPQAEATGASPSSQCARARHTHTHTLTT